MASEFEIFGRKTFRVRHGEREMIANFEAVITEEIRYIDGENVETFLIIEGMQQDGEENDIKLGVARIRSTEFPSMSWVMPLWGVRAVIAPVSNAKEDLRAAIQYGSNPKQTNVFRSTGWTTINGQKAYLHSGGAIKKGTFDTRTRVELPMELSRYILTQEGDVKDAVRATLALRELGAAPVMWTLLAATVTPLHGPVDFGVHLTGRTGTFKSEVCSLFQSHYGYGMDARHLPGSWSSTPNALEAQAYYAANAVFTVDDFVPSGTSYQQKAYQTTADKLIRAQGNQAGRARLTDISSLQTTMYPRGLVLSTGEDTPEGHSVRARMMICELSPGDIDTAKLTRAQKARNLYPTTLSWYIRSLAENWYDPHEHTMQFRDEYLDLGHTRTPTMLGRLLASILHFLAWAAEVKAISGKQQLQLEEEAKVALKASAEAQAGYLETVDPAESFMAAIRQVFAAGLGHARKMNGGTPLNPAIMGWVSEQMDSEVPLYKARGPTIGWVDHRAGEFHLDGTAGYNIVRKAGGQEITLSKGTMLKRLKDAGMMARCDDARQRNTVRVTAEGHPRQVICLLLSKVVEGEEGSDGGE